jgi:hypothetical protein
MNGCVVFTAENSSLLLDMDVSAAQPHEEVGSDGEALLQGPARARWQ